MIGPALTAFTRTPREINSPESVFVNEIIVGLRCCINARCRHPDVWIDRPVDYDRRWVREHRQQFLQQKVSLHVRVERSLKRHCVPLAERFQFDNPRIYEQHVQLSERVSDFFGKSWCAASPASASMTFTSPSSLRTAS